MLDIKYSQFFDAPKVLKKVKDGTKSALSKAGSFVRTRAMRSIRSRKKSATPGSPPSSHTGLLKSLIFFGYDDRKDSVVVGPKLFRTSNNSGLTGNTTAPHLLEFGGTGNHWKTGKPAVYRKFPFMEPALQAEQEKFPGLFSGSVGG